ncbi:MAG: alpha/beta hydrolase [Chloroflexi bacterium]|nr:alpha/beta hydrolase [Chloroflexota bacterium]
MPYVSVNGTSLHYLVDDYTDPWTQPETVLLHHAAGGSARHWYAWVPHLARRYRVIRLDCRGHGESAVPPANYRWDIKVLAGDVYALLRALEAPRAHIVGASAGGIIGLQFAHDYPEQTASLSLVAATPRLSQTRVDFGVWVDAIRTRGVRAWALTDIEKRFNVDRVPGGLIDWFADEVAKTPQSVVSTFVPYMASIDLRGLLPHIVAPTLVLAAGADDITPMEVQEEMRDRMPNARLVVLEGMAHNVAVQEPDRCAAELLRFLEGLR